METLIPSNDAENRHSVGGRKRSSRRSSILKTAKSPLKMALEDIDPNSLGSGKENRDKKSSRGSSSRRVSFAETYQVKEFCKDEEWNAIWQRENSTITSDQAEQSDLSPSEYRQPTDRIRGLESLLKGDIQNTGQELQDQDELSMDFTFCGNMIEQSGRQSLKSLENNNQDQENRVEDGVNALELTCHGQGLINQDDRPETDVYKQYGQSSGSRKESTLAQDMRRPGLSDYVQYYQTQTQREKARVSSNKENEGMDFNVCHGGRFDGPMTSQTTAVFDPKLRDVDFKSVELTCHSQGLVRANAKSFLASLGKSKVGVSKDSASNTSAFGRQDSSYATSNINNTLALSNHGRTELPDVTEPEEDMEMTACLDVVQTDTKTTVNLNAPVPEEGMDMTACVPPAPRLQNDHLAMPEGQMDMTACVPPASRLQNDHLAMSEGQMDMTACVPPASGLKNDHLAMSEGQMDMTACVPPASRLQNDHLAMSEGQMDMTACVPPASSSSIVTDEDLILNKSSKEEREGIEMTIPNEKLQLSAQDEHPTSGNKGHVSNDTENDSCLKPAPLLVYQTDSRKRQSSSSIDSSLQSETPREKKKQLEIHHDHFQRIDSHSSGNKKLGSSIQSWLNRSMPIVDQKKSQATFLRSLPTLSKSLMEYDGPGNKNIPHATFAPVSNVPISKFCSQPAMKRKMIHIDHLDGFQGLSQTKYNTEEQTFASSSDVNQEDNSPKDSLKPDNATETVQPCNQGDDVTITFKDPICSMAGSSGDNQTKDESVINGLMDEPTLEMDFTDQSAISVGLTALNDTSHQEGEEEVPTPSSDDNIPSHTESHDQSQQVAKQQAKNLSVICEENEVNSSKVADRTLMTGKQETSVKQKSMTVSELLSRANISFQNIEQISRRSTIAFMRKTEKPKEEKEFIQLSLVKKPQAISYGDICTNIQKELEKLKETMDRQETELNESNASILQQVDDSKMAKLEVTLKELKNICKKCAYRKWIRRTGAMKKKLAMTLKENYEVLSEDVRNVDETLLVTNDCLQLIDSIDDEIEKGMESLRKSIEKSEMENADLDKVEATLHEKKSELESREEELKDMENQRSSLASSKESLSSEKETLEREQLAHDEMLSQIRNKPSSCESNESLSEKYKLLEGCLEWELTERNQNYAKFLFLYDTLEMRVDFHHSDTAQSCSSQPVAKKIQNISVSSQLADDSHLSARFVHSLVINSLDEELLHSSNSNTSSLPKVLEHVSGLVIAARSLGNELFELNFQHILTMRENSIFIEFSSVKAFMKFIVQLTINVCKYPDEVEITVIPKIGKCCAQEIQDALISIATGPKYMSRLVETARQFLDKK